MIDCGCLRKMTYSRNKSLTPRALHFTFVHLHNFVGFHNQYHYLPHLPHLSRSAHCLTLIASSFCSISHLSKGGGILPRAANRTTVSASSLPPLDPDWIPHPALFNVQMLLIGLTGSIATGKSTVASILASPPYNLPIIDADQLARQVVAPGTHAYAEIVEYFGRKLGMEDLFLEVEGNDTSGTNTTAAQHTPRPVSTMSNTLAHSHAPSTAINTTKSSSLRPLNRAALGRRVFGPSPSAQRDRKVLNRITHPRVRLAMLRLILYYYITGHWAVVLDIPLLFESGLDIFCGGVMMVAVRDPEIQMRRLLDRDRGKGLERKEAENRVLSQGRVEEKVGRTRERGAGRGVVVWNDGGLGELREEVERALGETLGLTGETEIQPATHHPPPPPSPSPLPSPSANLHLPPHQWWTWWLWASPWAAALVASVEVWRGWTARRRWEARARTRAEGGRMEKGRGAEVEVKREEGEMQKEKKGE